MKRTTSSLHVGLCGTESVLKGVVREWISDLYAQVCRDMVMCNVMMGYIVP